ncbi:class I SAM-dependent methyltransferase [Paenibacillus sp. UNC451MF]|uniref:class I SAM-dependent methyltransferase n=1 Tax=Paenibacillus sp. UNC451MF TaxID=1449063 RepID=UPI00048A543F|nr:class I SAM-dependent methyltransferase [Paenibacillus sp. UNC451MF]
MNGFDYKNFYDKVGAINGWDFSRIQCHSEGVKWDFYHEVAQRCKQSHLLLDIGTGGGEQLLTIVNEVLLLVGIDISDSMIRTANSQLAKESNVRFLQMDAGKLSFPDSFFNVISCRQSDFTALEVARVLAEDGVFLTQQVAEGDKLNLKQAFQRGQSYGEVDGLLKHQYIHDLQEAGFKEIQSFEYDVTEYYRTYEDLVFLLKYTPVIPNFGQEEHDFDRLRSFIEENGTAKGILTNIKNEVPDDVYD